VELPAWLERRGYTSGYGWTKFTRPAGNAPAAATELRVEHVEVGEAFAEAFVRGYGTPEFFRAWVARLPGRPGWHCFVAFDGTASAGVGALHATGAVGWLGIAATVPEHRRKGAQNAILAARVDAAAEAGCEVVATETGEPRNGEPGSSWRNISRAGFEPQYVRPNYLSAPDADTVGNALGQDPGDARERAADVAGQHRHRTDHRKGHEREHDAVLRHRLTSLVTAERG
jgi:hypothetical protein